MYKYIYIYFFLLLYRLCQVSSCFFRKYASQCRIIFHDRARLPHVRDWQKFISHDLHAARKLRVWCAYATRSFV